MMGSGGWCENLGAEAAVREGGRGRERERESCSEVKWRNSCRLVWCVNQRLERRGSCCEEKWRTEYAVTVKRLSSESARGLVARQRKESCEVK